VISAAQQTIEALRTEHGQVIEDDESLLTALSSEGIDVETIIRRLVHAALDAKANAAGADLRIRDLTMRRDRFEHQQERYRETVLNVLQALDLKTFKDPEFSLSVRDGNPKVVIVDADALPEMMMKVTITRAPDKALIKAVIDGGQEVPGALSSNATPVLAIRSR
jgi:hypothetical protein